MDEQSSLLTPVLHNIQRPPGSGDALDGTTSPSAAVSVSSDPPMPEDTGRFGRPYFRFTIVFAALIVVIATMPLWLSAATPKYSVAVCGSVTILIGLEWLAIAANAVLNYRRLSRVPIPNWPDVVALRSRRFKHIVIVPCYLDPLDVLQKCIGSLAVSARAQDLITVVTFERKTPELERKMEAVQVAFGDSCFGDFLAVVHDLDPATEIPGGCSNKNFALRTAFAFCTRKYGTILNDHTTRVTLTTCDTDSLFHPLYFEVLESAYNTENPTKGAPRNCVWQPPLFYNWGLDSRPFFNRVTCLMRTMMMLGGLISFNLNPMSIFSYPLEMGYAAGFINPRYGVDDIIAKVRWMCDTNSAVPVKLLPVPVISGPTIGQSFAEEATEWGRQIRRWIVGSSESFHYFLIHFRGRPFFAGLGWFATFFSYYGVLLCCAGVFSVFAAIPLPWQEEAFLNVPGGFRFNLRYCGAVSLGLQMVAFAVAFLIDAVGAPRLGVKEDIHPIRNLIHWITSPFVLLTYSVISLVSIVRFVFQGKKMAGHDMAAKEGFSSVSLPLPSTAASVSESPAARWQVVQSRGSILP